MTEIPHIARAFDRDLDAVQALVMQMGGLVETALGNAVLSLERRDDDLAEQVRRGDAAIDALEDQVNTECALLIARRAPAANDLRLVLSVMEIAGALERCGDYAKNLAKRSMVMSNMPQVPGAASGIKRLAQLVGMQVKRALDAYIARDALLAAEVRQQDHEVDQIYTALFREFLSQMIEDPRNITPCMHLHFIAKNIERVGDHATTIAEQVIYLATGSMPSDDRPKAETVLGNEA